jgi:hypothetical protein
MDAGRQVRRRQGSKESIDHYPHVYYDDIEDIYRRRIFKLGS